MSHLIDSNIVIEMLRNRLIPKSSATLILCAPVLGELYFGALRSHNPPTQMQEIARLSTKYTVLPCNELTARHYADIRHALEAAGGRIPENDMWIAALAIQHQLTLVTRDTHFARISGLTIETW